MHRLGKLLAVLRHLDRTLARTDELDSVFLQDPGPMQIHGDIERGLTTHRRQQRVRLFALDDLFDPLHGDRLDIGAIRDVGIGHDRRRIRVHQHDAVALFLEGAHGLGTRIVELAGLADDDRPGAQDENGL